MEDLFRTTVNFESVTTSARYIEITAWCEDGKRRVLRWPEYRESLSSIFLLLIGTKLRVWGTKDDKSGVLILDGFSLVAPQNS